MQGENFEQKLEQFLKRDFSAGTDAFRDALLERCLKELSLGSREDGSGANCDDWALEIADADLDFLAAAGDIMQDPKDR